MDSSSDEKREIFRRLAALETQVEVDRRLREEQFGTLEKQILRYIESENRAQTEILTEIRLQRTSLVEMNTRVAELIDTSIDRTIKHMEGRFALREDLATIKAWWRSSIMTFTLICTGLGTLIALVGFVLTSN